MVIIIIVIIIPIRHDNVIDLMMKITKTITSNMFRILKKCSSKFDCLLYEMFLIREHKPCLNIQSDSIKAELFT